MGIEPLYFMSAGSMASAAHASLSAFTSFVAGRG